MSKKSTPYFLDDEEKFYFDERAGMMEFSGNLPREKAEELALVEMLNRRKKGIVYKEDRLV